MAITIQHHVITEIFGVKKLNDSVNVSYRADYLVINQNFDLETVYSHAHRQSINIDIDNYDFWLRVIKDYWTAINHIQLTSPN